MRRFLLALALFSFTTAFAAPIPMRVEATARQADGRIVFAGDSRVSGGPERISVGRLNADGSFDTSFGSGGIAEFVATYDPWGSEFRVTAMTVRPDGKIIIAAVKDGYVALVCLDATGAPDYSFGYYGGMHIDLDSAGQRVMAIGAQSNGSIIAAGSYSATQVEGDWDLQLVRYHSYGLRDYFASGPYGSHVHPMSAGDNEARALVVLPDDSLVIAGTAKNAGADKDLLVAKFQASGYPDYSFGMGGKTLLNAMNDDEGSALAVDSLGRIVVGGRNGHGMGYQTARQFLVYRLSSWGWVDTQYFHEGSGIFIRDGWNILDAELTSIAITPGTDSILAGGHGRDLSTGVPRFAALAVDPFGGSYNSITPIPGTHVQRGLYTNGTWAIAVGTRTEGGVDYFQRARYAVQYPGLVFDTDFSSEGADSVPNAFDFGGWSQQGPSLPEISGPVTITGIDVPAPVTVANGEYSIGCTETFTQAPGTILAGQTICARHVSAATPSTFVTTVVTIGGVEGAFSSQTGTVADTVISTFPTSAARPNFAFHSYGTPAAFECQLDGAAYAPCSNPHFLDGWTLANGSHTLNVRATNVWGADQTPATYTWSHTQPDTSISSGPSGTTTQTTAVFDYSGNGGGWALSWQCSLDGAPFTTCGSDPITYTNLASGEHVFQVRIVIRDAYGVDSPDPTPATRTWTVDTVAPETTIATGPSGTVGEDTASFTFSSSESGATFECSLDAAAFAACTSPKAYSTVAQGMHMFEVRARDAAGNVDATPALRSWSVDTTNPNTTISSGPDMVTFHTDATLVFSANETGVGFLCSLDGGAFAACTSPKSYSGLAGGGHSFSVYATDAAGNPDNSPATWSWAVDLAAPETTLSGGPTGTVTQTTAAFTFGSPEPGVTFECRLDAAAFATCASPVNLSGLADGAHTFEVRAKDPAGNPDPTPASRTWTVDTTAPQTTITVAPAAATNQTIASFTFASSETGSTFQCKLDSGSFSSCTSPKSYSGLSAASHTFQVRATDALGQQDATPATHTWTVDTSAPSTTLNSGPSGTVSSTSATFTFSSNQTGSTFECRMDNGSFAACTSPKAYTGLSPGSHTFRVRAIDPAGNVDASPATRTWTIN
ncbi:hypothetical protein [Usitatibacter palustris]|uniref:Ig-like domain-containing protein n=1 Tax=Usitatibacter palustris TaxID=2732487 RepID=A0A6M4H611_9PROT|nr:hypothetical protein [Usitatibacter palustris]QJR15056.1 hypothetical protein DSM104440_01872 [Usitatibacter palustris]